MMSISETLHSLQTKLKEIQEKRPFKDPIQLMSVSKYYTTEQLEAVISAGQTLFGENKVQDLQEKVQRYAHLGLTWHLIGHLQTNKVKKVVPLVSCIQSIDSLKVLECINQECEKIGKVMDVFIQVKVAEDPNKFGLLQSDCEALILSPQINSLCFIRIKGIMTIVPESKDAQLLLEYFREARAFFDRIKIQCTTIDSLSMGMSGDFELAAKEGSTLVRIGSKLVSEG